MNDNYTRAYNVISANYETESVGLNAKSLRMLSALAGEGFLKDETELHQEVAVLTKKLSEANSARFRAETIAKWNEKEVEQKEEMMGRIHDRITQKLSEFENDPSTTVEEVIATVRKAIG